MLRRHADLAQPRADHPRRRARDGRLSLLRPRDRARSASTTMMAALGKAQRRRRRPAPRLLPQSDRRRPRPRPVARGRRRLSRARADPVRRHRLSGVRARARRGCGRACAACSTQCDEVDRRAELRQEFQLSIATGSARCSSRPARREATATAMAMCSSARAKCGRCRPTMAPRRSRIILEDPELRAPLAGRARRDARAHQLGRASGSPPPTRGSLISAGRTACSRCCR